MIVVILSPIFDLLLRIGKLQELIDVQSRLTQSSVKTLYVSVFNRFSGMDEVELRVALFSSPPVRIEGGEN